MGEEIPVGSPKLRRDAMLNCIIPFIRQQSRESPTTLLRRIMALPTDAVGSVKQLGIDDFALRRGRNYGTVLVDLVRHRVLDLLPDRKAETAKVWMQAHPEIDLVSRDRGGDYASAASLGAPQAAQSAERFHLVKNLTEAVQKA